MKDSNGVMLKVGDQVLCYNPHHDYDKDLTIEGVIISFKDGLVKVQSNWSWSELWNVRLFESRNLTQVNDEVFL
jgi:hypothetical protein